MAKKISSNDLFNPDLFTKTKDDALVYLSVLKDIEKEHHDLLAVQGQLVKTAKKNDVSGLKQRESAIKKITVAEKELLQVERAIEKTEAKLNLSSSEQVRKLAELRDSLNRKNNAQRDSIKIAREDSDAYKRLSRSVNEAQANFKRLSAQFGINSKQAMQAKIALDGVQKEMMQIDAAARDGRRNVGRYGTAFSGLGKGLKSIGMQFVALTALIYGIGRAMVSSYKIFRDFQQGSANLAAVMGKTRKEVKALTDDAKRLGATTVFTASQVIELQVAYSKLGFKEDEILAATEATLALAAATGTDLNESATVVAQTLNGFGLEADETNRVVDVMAKAFTESALDMSKFSVAMANVSTAAKIGGFSVEKTTAALGLLVDRGIDASKAGTDLRKMFSSIAKDGITFQEAMDKINNSTDKTVTAIDLFGERSFAAGIILAENNENLTTLETKLKNAGGAAQEMAETQLDTLSGATTRLSSAWEGFILSLEDGDGVIANVFRGLIDYATTALEVFAELSRSEKQSIENRLRLNNEFGSDSALDNQKALLEYQKLSNEELKKINAAGKENSAIAGLILQNRKDGLSVLEQQVFMNALTAIETKKQLKAFDELAKNRDKYTDSEWKALLAKQGIELELLDIEERRDKAILEGMNNESKALAIAALKKASQEELLALIAKEAQFNQTKGGQASIYLAKQELQRRKDIGQQIDINAEAEDKKDKKKDKKDKDKQKEVEQNADVLFQLLETEKQLRSELNEEIRISGGLETERTKDLNGQLSVLDELIKKERVLRAAGTEQAAPLDKVVRGEKTNDELLADYQKYLDDKKKTEDDAKKEEEEKAKEAAEKEKQLFNDRLSAATDFYNQLNQLSNERIEKQLANIDKEIEASKERQTQLEAIAAQGQLDAQQSVKSEIKRQAELENEKAQLELKKQRREALSSGFSLLAANLEKGATGDDAVVQTFRQMTNLIALISNLPGFYVGTDNAPEGLAWTDEKGAEIHLDKDGNIKDFGSNAGPQLKYLTKGDKILTAGESNIVKRQLNMQPALEAKERKSAVAMNDARIVQAVQSVVQAVNDKPVQEFDYDKIQQAVIDSIKGNGEINRKHISNKPKF